MAWTWRLEDAGGTGIEDPVPPAHANQSDAESWLGENWRELADAGVVQVRLLDGDAEVYGPMPLAEA